MRTTEPFIDGLYFGEGPRWHDGRLWFSDFFDFAVKAADTDGNVEVIVEVPNRPSGLGWLPDGRLLIVSMVDRKLLRLEAGGLVEHADLSGLATFHCNDMVVDAHGRAYVGNFGFDLDHSFETRGTAETFAEHPTAVLAHVDPDGSVHIAATDMHFPNGALITPDGATLIVAETLASRLTAFDVGDDGTLTNRRVWADLAGKAPDGICLDADGHIWVANPVGSECLLVEEGGRVIESIATGETCIACTLGGDDRRTLFMLTCQSSVAEVASASRAARIVTARVDVPGAGLP